MQYPAKFAAAPEGGFVITFRDIPECITQADSKIEGYREARDALVSAMEFYFEDKRAVPAPSAPQAGEELITLPLIVWAKILLLNEVVAQPHMRPADLARAMNVRPQEITRILDLSHPTKIDTINEALMALGKALELRVVCPHD